MILREPGVPARGNLATRWTLPFKEIFAASWLNNPRLLGTIYVSAVLFSLWLKTAFPVYAIADAGHDDALFLRISINLIAHQWLGHYDQYRLIKGMFYPLFIDFSFLSGVPLKLLEQIVYLSVSFLLCRVVKQTTGRGWPALLLFILLAFNPIVFYPNLARVIREGLYMSLSLAVVAFAVGAFLIDRSHLLKVRLLWLIGLGLAGGAFWLTREEGMWILPALVPVLGLWFLRRLSYWRRRQSGIPAWRALAGEAAVLAVPAACFLVVVNIVNVLNLQYYGVFRNNDMRSADFQAAFGAIARIRQDRWRPYVVFPRDARERAYAVSSAAAELKPYFDGPKAELWHNIGCAQTGTVDCPEILAGWFVWAFRDAVADAGHYQTATAARDFYLRLAEEINTACAAGRIACLAPRATLMPPFRSDFIEPTLRAAGSAALHLIRLGGGIVGSPPSVGTPDNLALFQDMLGGAITPTALTPIGNKLEGGDSVSKHKLHLQLTIARSIAAAYAMAVPVLLVIATLVLVAGMIRRGRIYGDASILALALACLFAAIARVLLLAYIDATAFPADNDLYLSPATPFVLGFIGLCLIEGLTPRAEAAEDGFRGMSPARATPAPWRRVRSDRRS